MEYKGLQFIFFRYEKCGHKKESCLKLETTQIDPNNNNEKVNKPPKWVVAEDKELM